ncbi:MAG TPA: hypothetical protein PL135_07170 [Spirochaetota bacterium]|nr:MAG: hypothetical protein BWY96_00976 [Spirochaetes bacterium ADurb.BinA120]HPI14379.1 hypothetical protein [Spirochaetota bacterium]
MEKDYLQSLKVEISRSFKLAPYERMAFHRLLGLVGSENGMRILLRELEQEPFVRESAFLVLKEFDRPEVGQALMDFVNGGETSVAEKLCALENIERYGSADDLGSVISFIENNEGDPSQIEAVEKAFSIIRIHGAGSGDAAGFVRKIAVDREKGVALRCFAIEALSAFKDVSLYEDLLKERNETISCGVYNSLAMLSDAIMKEAEESRGEEDVSYTYAPEFEDRLILNVRVLLGKMTSQFDSYSRRVRAAFINAMICANHREFLIYTMKALTSDDRALIDMVLRLLYSSSGKLRDPDKLFRNLLALSVEDERDNEMIVAIFERFFLNLKENRINNLLRDKLFNYITVTLETYFETYRREFMVTEVMEKDFPESFRVLRRFILDRFTPEMKKRIVHFLRNVDRTLIQEIIRDLAGTLPYIRKEDNGRLEILMEVLYDMDPKSRDNSALRIEGINFEKRYLRNRIARLCEIIARLKIEEAASTLVKILNYVKKYPDEDISSAVSRSLSMLNYSYMLGELEVQLSTGDAAEQGRAIRLLSLFSDQRSLNILIDFLRERVSVESEDVERTLDIFLHRDVAGNVAANTVFKQVAETNGSPGIARLAVLCIGRGGVEADIEYLNDLFAASNSNDIKEAVVQAIGHIVFNNASVNRRQVIKYLLEYLKDSAIKVRIHSCALLLSMGNKEAIKSLRDMMVIKNRQIQREILAAVGPQRSTEFSYFLISLLKEEYGISHDIIRVVALLPAEELSEIDHFIVNIFRKYDGAVPEVKEPGEAVARRHVGSLSRDSLPRKTFLNVEMHGYEKFTEGLNPVDVVTGDRLVGRLVTPVVTSFKGFVSQMVGGRVVVVFDDEMSAAEAGLRISENIRAFNEFKAPEGRLFFDMQIMTGGLKIMNGEVMELPEHSLKRARSLSAINRIIADAPTAELEGEKYHCVRFIDVPSDSGASTESFFELLSPVNFSDLADTMIAELIRRDQDRLIAQMEIEVELRKRKNDQKTGGSVEYAQAMDDVGRVLRDDLAEIVKYVQKRSTDRELISTVERMVSNVNKRYLAETTRIIVR